MQVKVVEDAAAVAGVIDDDDDNVVVIAAVFVFVCGVDVAVDVADDDDDDIVVVNGKDVTAAIEFSGSESFRRSALPAVAVVDDDEETEITEFVDVAVSS